MSGLREEDYRGHRICVEADKRRPNAWGWSYLIDEEVAGQSAPTLFMFSMDVALRFGMIAAQTRVDQMERK